MISEPANNGSILSIYVDNKAVLVANKESSDNVAADPLPISEYERSSLFESLVIHAGQFAGGATEGSVLWDSIMLMPSIPGVTASVDTTQYSSVSTSLDSEWRLLPVQGPPSRQGHSLTTVGSNLYLFGGERSSFEHGDLYEFDCAAETWKFISVSGPAPAGRHDHAAFAYDGALCIIGGRASGTALNDMWCIRPAETNNVWTAMSIPAGFAGRYGHTATILQDNMYVFGGFVPDYATVTAETWRFDIATGDWTALGPLSSASTAFNANPGAGIIMGADVTIPAARMGHSACAVGSALYVHGGTGYSMMGTMLSDEWLWMFEPEFMVWTQVTDLSALADHAYVCLSEHIITKGGKNQDHSYNDGMQKIFLGMA